MNRVLAAGKLEQYVLAYAHGFAANAPLTISSVKRCLIEMAKNLDNRDLALCERVVDECFNSKDFIEGRTAFMEKRRPSFTGS